MQEQLKHREVLSYGLGDFACGMIYNFVFTYVFYYYSDVIKLSLGAVGVIMVAGRGLVTVMDLVAGMLIDRTHTKFGSARPYLLWFFIPLGIITVLLFTTIPGSPQIKTVYAVITYVAYSAVYALLNDPYTLLMSTITGREDQRLRLNRSKTILSGTGGILVMLFTLKGAEMFDHMVGKRQILGVFYINGFTLVSLIYAFAGMFFLFICFRNTKERISADKETCCLKTAFLAARRNRFFRAGILIGCFINLALTVKLTSTLYYAQYVMHDKSLSNILLTLHMVLSIVAVLCLPVFIKKTGRKGTFFAGGLLVILGSLLQWKSGSFMAVFFFGTILISFSLNMLNSLSVFVIFDTIDYTQKTDRVRPHGFMFSVYCVICKMSTAVAAAMLSAGMSRSGYIAGQLQSRTTLKCITAFYLFVPALFAVCIIVSASFFTIEKELGIQKAAIETAIIEEI